VKGSLEKLSPESVKILRDRCKRDLYFLAKGVLGFDFLVPHIHLPLCKILKPENHYLKITLPRGWLKTTVCSCAYPIWRAINDANVRILLVQNTHLNACQKLRKIRDMFERNPLFRTLFPELLPTGRNVWKTDELCVTRPGSFEESTFGAAGANTQVTSRHYDLIIEDDTAAPDLEDLSIQFAAPSPEDIEQAIGWHRLVPPLMIDLAKSQNIVVGTRWAELDLLSWIEKEEDWFKSYRRAVREVNGEADPEGPAMYPERFNDQILSQLEKSMGPYMFSALYMNLPMRAGTMTFRPEWFMYYESEPRDLITYTTVDVSPPPSETKKKDPDFNVVITCGKDLMNGKIFVLHYWRKRANPSEVIDEIFRQQKLYKPVKVGIEGVAYQSSMSYWVRERMQKEGVYFLVDSIKHGRVAKEKRIEGLQPIVAAGAIHFKTWMTSLINELLAFPLGRFDDIADALAMQQEMWAATKTYKEAREGEKGSHPLDFNSAVAELEGRREKKKTFPADVMRIGRERTPLAF
jgi:predicted phage terminase large subunit-like protein